MDPWIELQPLPHPKVSSTEFSLRTILCASRRNSRYVTESSLVDVPYRCRPTRTGTALAAGRLPPFLDASVLGRYGGRKSPPIDAAAEPFLVEDRVVSIGAVRFPAISEKSSPERSCHESTIGNLPCPQRIRSILLPSPVFQDIPRRDLVQEVAPGRPFPERLPVGPLPFPAFPAFPQDPHTILFLPPIDIFPSDIDTFPSSRFAPSPSHSLSVWLWLWLGVEREWRRSDSRDV